MKLKRMAFIGARGHYDWVLRSLGHLPHVRVAGLCDTGDESMAPLRTWCREQGHTPAVFVHEHLPMLDRLTPDAVVICGPLEQHAQMTIDCITRGIHVLVEKPLALTFPDLERLRAALEDHPDVHLAALQTSRYQAGFYTARRLVQGGAIGDVRLLNAQKSYKFGSRTGFYQNRETYGGTIPWVGSHAVDWILWIGGHRIRSVSAMHTTSGHTHAGGMELAALCQFELCGDRFASVTIDMLRPATAATHGDDRLRIVGAEGVLDVTPTSVRLINGNHSGAAIAVPLETPPDIVADFAAHVEGRGRALIDAQDSLATTAACLLARESADHRRPLDADSYTRIPMKSVRTATSAAETHMTTVTAT